MCLLVVADDDGFDDTSCVLVGLADGGQEQDDAR